MGNVEFRRARQRDFTAIVKIQSANYVGNLSAKELREGFLSAEFTPEQVAEMAGDLGIIVASDSGSILGYLCGLRCDFGPVCIDRPHRRRGLLRGLYEALKNEIAGQFEVGVAFVARDNSHSLQAHVAGLGMTDVGDFEVKGKIYAILAFSAPLKSS